MTGTAAVAHTFTSAMVVLSQRCLVVTFCLPVSVVSGDHQAELGELGYERVSRPRASDLHSHT